MKPLKRPMFRSGGPIKEGIMDGMKEPQAINTVGSPFAPKDASGRQGYALPIAMLLGAAGRALARPLGTFVAKQFARPGVTGSGNLIRSGLGRTRVMQPGESLTTTKNIFEPNVVGRYLMGSPEFRAGKAIVQGTGRFGKPIKATAKGLASSPLTVLSAGGIGGKAIYDRLTKEKTPEAQKDVEAAGGPPGGGDSNMFLTPKEKELSAAQKDKIVKDRIEENRQRYYKLMGIDKMQKGAAYDSLIDASRIIQEEGGDLKGAIKSGSLQSQIINAISKNLDKSTDLKRQIDAAILKGEIEKDIKASDPSAKLAAELTKKRIELADKSLEGGDLSEDLIAAYNKQGSFPAGNQLAGFARAKGIDVDGVEDTQEVKKWMKDNKSDEEGYLSSLVKEGKVPDGTYVINNRIFTVSGDDITSVV